MVKISHHRPPEDNDDKHSECKRGYKHKKNCPNYGKFCDTKKCPPGVPIDHKNIGICAGRRHNSCDFYAARHCNQEGCGRVAQEHFGRTDPHWIRYQLGQLIKKISRRN